MHLKVNKKASILHEERYQFREWAASLIQTIDFTRSRKKLENGNAITIILRDYFKELIKRRKHSPEEDLISLLIMEEQHGDRLTEEELLATCILLVISGHETTVNLISNSILTLLKHPHQLIELKEKPLLIEGAVEEFLRYESPTQMTARIAKEDIEIHKTTIKKGDQIYVLLGAANRDPNKFNDPHLAFGYGTHFCLGASLARFETQIAINSLLAWKDNLQLVASNLKWRKLIGFRSLNELQIIFD